MAFKQAGFQGRFDQASASRRSAQHDVRDQTTTGLGATVAAGVDRTINIGPGAATATSAIGESDSVVAIQHDAATVRTRIDTIIYDFDWSTRLARIVAKKGSTAVTEAPGMTFSPGARIQVPLFDVPIAVGTGAFPSNLGLVDRRPGKVARGDFAADGDLVAGGQLRATGGALAEFLKLTRGRRLNGVDFGYLTATTSLGSKVFVPHILGAVPVIAKAWTPTAQAGRHLHPVRAGHNADRLVFEVYGSDDELIGNGFDVVFEWLAVR